MTLIPAKDPIETPRLLHNEAPPIPLHLKLAADDDLPGGQNVLVCTPDLGIDDALNKARLILQREERDTGGGGGALP